MKRDHLFIDAWSRARHWLLVLVPCRSNGHLESAAFGADSAQYAKFIRKGDCADFAFGYSDIRSATARHKRPALVDSPQGWKPVGSHPAGRENRGSLGRCLVDLRAHRHHPLVRSVLRRQDGCVCGNCECWR